VKFFLNIVQKISLKLSTAIFAKNVYIPIHGFINQ